MKERKKLSTVRKLKSGKSEAFFLAVRGVEVGIFAGLISVLYRYLLSIAENSLNKVLAYVGRNGIKIAIWLIILGFLGFFVAYINKKNPTHRAAEYRRLTEKSKAGCRRAGGGLSSQNL